MYPCMGGRGLRQVAVEGEVEAYKSLFMCTGVRNAGNPCLALLVIWGSTLPKIARDLFRSTGMPKDMVAMSG